MIDSLKKTPKKFLNYLEITIINKILFCIRDAYAIFLLISSKILVILFYLLIFCSQTYSLADESFRTRTTEEWELKYKRESLEMRGGMSYLKVEPAKNTRELTYQSIERNKIIDKFLSKRDIFSLLVYENGKIIYDYKLDFVKSEKAINGESRSKSVVGVMAAGLSCAGKLDLRKEHSYYSTEISESFYGGVTLNDSLSMTAGDREIDSYNLKKVHNKKIDIVKSANLVNKNKNKNKRIFYYSNINSDILTITMINALGGVEEFKRALYNLIVAPAGLKNDVFLLQDINGNIISSSSIMMTRKDWLRFSIYVIGLLRDEKSCEGGILRRAFGQSVPTGKTFGPGYAMFFWLGGYGVKDLVQMRGWGLKLSLLDWRNGRVILVNSGAISWKPQELIDLFW